MFDRVIYLMGPTAAGKTDLAFKLVDRFDCEIISVDSALIYRDMNIGTAKPDKNTLAQYPHHLVDIISPVASYSVGEFCFTAKKLIEEIQNRQRVPLLVGGTMMYFNALENGLAQLPKTDPNIREELLAELNDCGLDVLYERLSNVDAETAHRVNRNDTQRILRALEVWKITGLPLSKFHREQNTKQESDKRQNALLKLCLNHGDRSLLHKKIAQRFNAMLADGLVEEVEGLKRKHPELTVEMPSMRCVGYRQVWQYLNNEYNVETMREKGIVATRQLAKRQITWLRGMRDVSWFESDESIQDVLDSVGQFLQ